jgi:hypothetical protein
MTMRLLQRRLRRGSVRKNRPARVAVLPIGSQPGGRVLDVGFAEESGTMVRVVVAGVELLSARARGVKRQDEPEGTPPLQEKVTVELKPPEGVTVSVMALEALPRAMVVVDVEGESAKVPMAWITEKASAVEEAAAWVASPE